MTGETTQEEYDEVHRLLEAVQPQYPSLTLDELHQIFDDTYERLITTDPRQKN